MLAKISLGKLPTTTKVLLVLLGFNLLLILALLLHPLRGLTTGSIILSTIIPAIFIPLLHEGLHGITFWFLSRSVRFGVKWSVWLGPIFYTTSNRSLSRNKYILVGLFPQIISLFLLLLIVTTNLPPLLYNIVAVSFILNFVGGIADMSFVCILLKYPSSSVIRDTKDGFEVFSDEGLFVN